MRWSPTIALVVAMAGLLASPPVTRALELVRNGGFEEGRSTADWVQQDTRDAPAICGPGAGCMAVSSSSRAHSGRWWTRFGGASLISFGQTSSIRQTVSATAGTPLTLTFWLWIGQSNQSAALNVMLDDHVLFAVRGDDARYSSGYVPIAVPVHGSLVTGGPQTLLLEFDSLPGILSFHAINVDDVSLQAPDIDLGVGLASTPATVTRGSTFSTTISAGNGGPHGADGVSVEYPLPTGATLVGLSGDAACAAAETAPGHVMHCDFGTMPGGVSKAVTATFSADAVGTITQHATVAARTGDANGANHAASATVTVVAPPVAAPDPPKAPACTPPKRFTVPIRTGTKGTDLMLGKYSAKKARVLSARLTGPKRFKAQRLRHTRSRVTVDLRKLAAGRYTVRARVRVSSRKTINVTRVYTSCGASKASSKATSSKAKPAKTTSSKAKPAKSTSSKAKRKPSSR